jgi:hypothetical protein
MLSHRTRFVRRTNQNGTTDSICCKCFVTVATARRESELDRPERTHVCDPALLRYWKQMAEGEQAEDGPGDCRSFCPG